MHSFLRQWEDVRFVSRFSHILVWKRAEAAQNIPKNASLLTFLWCWLANTASVWSNPPMTPLPMPRKLCAHPGTYGTTGYTRGWREKIGYPAFARTIPGSFWDHSSRIFQEFFFLQRRKEREHLLSRSAQVDGHCNLASYSIGCSLHSVPFAFSVGSEFNMQGVQYSTCFGKNSGLSEPHICIGKPSIGEHAWCSVSSLLLAQQLYKSQLNWWPLTIYHICPSQHDTWQNQSVYPPQEVPHKQGFNKAWRETEGIVFIALYRYAFLAAGGGWADLPVDGSSAGGETASRSDIELVARLLERRHLGKKGTYHWEFLPYIKSLT